MKYELQFTVKTDAVKQNRKLPEIAFFDTDGNPISLGGGGSVDVSGLLPRDGSRAMTGPLDLGGPSLVFDDSSWYGSDYPVLGILGLEDSELDILESSVVAVSADGNHYSGFAKYGFFTDVESADSIPFGVQIGGGWHRFRINGDGTLRWGDGTAAPDVSLKRIAPGHLNIPGVDSGLIVGDPSGVYFGAYGNAYTEGYAAAADNWIHTVQVAGETGTRGVWRADGQLLWGDGTAAPDTTLERNSDWAGLRHPLGSDDYADFFIGDQLAGQLELYADATGVEIGFQFPLGADTNDIAFHSYRILKSFVDGGFNRFEVGPEGKMSWGDGTTVPDVSLKRTAPGTLEIDHTLSFNGDPSDPTSGQSLRWDQDWYGLTLTGKVGSGDASMYFLNVDNSTVFGGIWPGGMAAVNGENRVIINAVDHSLIFKGDGVFTRLHYVSTGVLEIEPPEGPGHSALRLHSPDGSLFDVSVANDGTLSAVAV